MKHFAHFIKKIYLVTMLALLISLIFWKTRTDSIILIHAQADYMAPGVPYKASCYIKKTLNISLGLKGPNVLEINNSAPVKIVIKNTSNKQISLNNIIVKVQYSPDLLQISDVNVNQDICQTDTRDLVNNDSQNGALFITLSSEQCGTIIIDPNKSIALATINILALSAGDASIKIDTQDTTNGSRLSLNSPANTQAYLNSAAPLNISIIQTENPTTISPTKDITPSLTPPNTGLLDNKRALIGIIIILGIAIILQIVPSDTNIKPIEYVEE